DRALLSYTIRHQRVDQLLDNRFGRGEGARIRLVARHLAAPYRSPPQPVIEVQRNPILTPDLFGLRPLVAGHAEMELPGALVEARGRPAAASTDLLGCDGHDKFRAVAVPNAMVFKDVLETRLGIAIKFSVLGSLDSKFGVGGKVVIHDDLHVEGIICGTRRGTQAPWRHD